MEDCAAVWSHAYHIVYIYFCIVATSGWGITFWKYRFIYSIGRSNVPFAKNKLVQIMKFIQSLQFAIRGIITFLRNETNGQIQLVAAIIVVTLGLVFQIGAMEWLVVVLCITVVLTLEMINTAIEKLCDVVQPDYHPQIKIIKDIAAGAVLIAALGSVIAGAIIFVPKIFAL